MAAISFLLIQFSEMLTICILAIYFLSSSFLMVFIFFSLKSVSAWTWLSDFPFTFHFHALEKKMATHSSALACRIPGTGEPGGLPSMGSHRIGQDWSDLAAAAAVPLTLLLWFSALSIMRIYCLSCAVGFCDYSFSLC